MLSDYMKHFKYSAENSSILYVFKNAAPRKVYEDMLNQYHKKTDGPARLVAGYCWPWPMEKRKDSDYKDIHSDEWEYKISWNLEKIPLPPTAIPLKLQSKPAGAWMRSSGTPAVSFSRVERRDAIYSAMIRDWANT